MEKAKSEVRTCEQGEKWSLSQVWRCLVAINVKTFGMDHCKMCAEVIVGLGS